MNAFRFYQRWLYYVGTFWAISTKTQSPTLRPFLPRNFEKMSFERISILIHSFAFRLLVHRWPRTATTCVHANKRTLLLFVYARTRSRRVFRCSARPPSISVFVLNLFLFFSSFYVPPRWKWQKHIVPSARVSSRPSPAARAFRTIDVFGIIIISVAQISRPYTCVARTIGPMFFGRSTRVYGAQSADPIFGHVFSRQRLVLADTPTGLGCPWAVTETGCLRAIRSPATRHPLVTVRFFIYTFRNYFDRLPRALVPAVHQQHVTFSPARTTCRTLYKYTQTDVRN